MPGRWPLEQWQHACMQLTGKIQRLMWCGWLAQCEVLKRPNSSTGMPRQQRSMMTMVTRRVDG